MWLSRRSVGFSLVALFGVSACGYSPAFAPSGAARTLLDQVQFEAPINRNEFDLVGQLEQRLGHSDAPVYRLSYTLGTSQDGTGLTPAQEHIRFNVVGNVKYVLKDIASGVTLTSGAVDNFTGYSVDTVDATASPPATNATISTLSAKRDANRRLMIILADQIVTRLVASAPRWSQ